MTWKRADEVVYEVVDGRAVLVNPAGEELITLNPVGTLVWETLEQPQAADGIVEQLLPQFDDVAEEQLRTDVGEFLQELRGLGLVELRAASA